MFSSFTDVGVCHSNGIKCDMNSTCVNVGGSPVCKCKLGFEENGTNCTGMFFPLFFGTYNIYPRPYLSFVSTNMSTRQL